MPSRIDAPTDTGPQASTCITESQIIALLDRRLTPESREAIDAHVSACQDCRYLLAEVTRGLNALQTPPGSAEESTPRGERPPRAALRDGTTVHGRYVILEVVGLGGMGIVYAGYDRKLDRKVALKLLRSDLTHTGDTMMRMLREAQIVARLSHPNIITVHDVGEVDGQIFIDMELVDGCTLRKWLASEPRPALPEILRVFLEAGRGLMAAHAAGVIHRDFKPDNVLVGRDGRVRVTDFGLARSLPTAEAADTSEHSLHPYIYAETETRTGVMAGTPAYMAPELRHGERATTASDQYAFCVALYEALHGERPTIDAAGRSQRGRSAGPRHARLEAALRRGLSPSPADRFPSMNALNDALARATRRRYVPAVLTVGAAAIGLSLGVPSTSGETTLCRGAEAQLAGVWDESNRDALREAFTRTGAPSAGASIDAVSRILDGYSERWSTAYTDACEATHVRGEQSSELLDLRMTCLHRSLDEVRELIKVITEADVALVDRAVEIAARIEPLDRCSATEVMLTRTPPPPPELREQIEAHQARCFRAKALNLAGRYMQAIELAQALVQEAETLRYIPNEQFATYLLGEAQMGVSAYAEAERSFRRMTLLNERNGHDPRALTGWLALAWSAAAQARHDDALVYASFAEAKLDQIGPRHPDYLKLAAEVRSRQSDSRIAQGHRHEAQASEREVLEFRRSDPKTAPTAVAASLNKLGNLAYESGDLDQAMAYYEEALQIRERELGPDHPRVAGTLNNIARVLQAQCSWAQARARFVRALDIRRRRYGQDHVEIANVLINIASLEEDLGDHQRAQTLAEQSLAMHTKLLPAEHPALAEDLTLLARVRLALGAPEEALERAQGALLILEKRLGSQHPDLADPLHALGAAQLALDRTADAVESLERAWALLTAQPSASRKGARTAFQLAQALWARGLHERARDAAGWARSAQPSCLVREAEELDAWIAGHR